MGRGSHIDINLSSNRICEAFCALKGTPSLAKQVQRVYINTNGVTDGTFLKRKNSSKILGVFRVVSNLPKLASVDIGLHHVSAAIVPPRRAVAPLPLKLLIQLFSGRNDLRALHLRNVKFEGDPKEISELDALLKKNTKLEKVKLTRVCGSEVVRVLCTSPRFLTGLELDGTSLPSPDSEVVLYRMLQSPSLQSLSLKHIPNFSNDHIKSIALELSLGHRYLKELTIISSSLGRGCGEAITRMLQFNEEIEKLVLHIDDDHIGYFMADALRCNSTLQSLDLRMHEDDTITESCISIAQALNGQTAPINSSLQKLRLCFELDPNDLDKRIIEAFRLAVEKNDCLQKICFEDSMDKRRLPWSMRFKLHLNRSGITKLLRCDSPNKDVYCSLVEALISEKRNLDMVFNILSEAPSLCVNASHKMNTYEKREEATKASFMNPMESSLQSKSKDPSEDRFSKLRILKRRTPKPYRSLLSSSNFFRSAYIQ